MSTEVFMVEIVMLSEITLCKLLIAVRVFLLSVVDLMPIQQSQQFVRVHSKHFFKNCYTAKILNLELSFETQSSKKIFFCANKSRSKNRKIDLITGKRERIAIKKENIFV